MSGDYERVYGMVVAASNGKDFARYMLLSPAPERRLGIERWWVLTLYDANGYGTNDLWRIEFSPDHEWGVIEDGVT